MEAVSRQPVTDGFETFFDSAGGQVLDIPTSAHFGWTTIPTSTTSLLDVRFGIRRLGAFCETSQSISQRASQPEHWYVNGFDFN